MFFAKYSNYARIASYISAGIALFVLYRNSDIVFNNWTLKVDLYLPQLSLFIVCWFAIDSFLTSKLSKWAKFKHIKSQLINMLGNQEPADIKN